MKDFSKAPTDAAIIKAFKEFEHAYNVFDAMLRHAPDKAIPDGNAGDVETGRNSLLRSHRVVHGIALHAEERREAAKSE